MKRHPNSKVCISYRKYVQSQVLGIRILLILSTLLKVEHLVLQSTVLGIPRNLATCVVTGWRIKSSLVASSGGDQLCETACLFHAYQPQRKNSTNTHLITQKYHASHQLSVPYPSQAFAKLGFAYSCELTLDNAWMPCAVTMQGLRRQWTLLSKRAKRTTTAKARSICGGFFFTN